MLTFRAETISQLIDKSIIRKLIWNYFDGLFLTKSAINYSLSSSFSDVN